MAIEAIKTSLPWGGDQLAMGDRLRLQVESGDATQVRESWEQITQPEVNTWLSESAGMMDGCSQRVKPGRVLRRQWLRSTRLTAMWD